MNKTIEEKLNEGRQYRALVEFRALEDDGKTVEGYATTFNQPYELFSFDGYTVREQISPTAFESTDMSDVIMQYDHEGRVFARTSNGTLSLSVDGTGLKIRADLSGTEIGRQLYEEIRGGYTTKMSFGFTVRKDERVETEDRENGKVDVLRTITDIKKLYDVSAVSLPANDATTISARTFCDGLIEEVKAEHLAREKRERQRKKLRILLEV